jgi:arsenate reductase
MTEGWARRLLGDRLEAFSAGTDPHGLDPRAVRVMAEEGVDISGQRSKHVDELRDVGFDYVVTVCDRARDACPVFPGKAQVLHASFEDPAAAQGTEEEVLAVFRRVRDEIRTFVERLPAGLEDN